MKKSTLLLLTVLAFSSTAFADVKKVWFGVDGIT